MELMHTILCRYQRTHLMELAAVSMCLPWPMLISLFGCSNAMTYHLLNHQQSHVVSLVSQSKCTLQRITFNNVINFTLLKLYNTLTFFMGIHGVPYVQLLIPKLFPHSFTKNSILMYQVFRLLLCLRRSHFMFIVTMGNKRQMELFERCKY